MILHVKSGAANCAALILLVAVSCPRPALAQATPAPAPAPYSLPWMMRPAAATSAIRIDQVFASYEDPVTGEDGSTAVTGLIATRKLSPRWVGVFRQMWVSNDPPAGGTTPEGSGFSNPLLGATYVAPLGGSWRWAGFLATTPPLGSGGGDDPDAGAAGALAAGPNARAQMDNAMLAVNYWAVIGGADVAYVRSGVTLQIEATVLQLFRTRGPDTQDEARTNFTAGLHGGYFLVPAVSLGAELRVQRWLTDAAPVKRDPDAREQFTVAAGPRFHFKVGGRHWLRPGISFALPLDDAMAERDYQLVQLDVPFVF